MAQRDLLVPVSLGLRAVMGCKDRWAVQESEGHRAKKDLKERRVSQGSVPALTEVNPSSLACRVLQVFPDHQGHLEHLGYRECLGITVYQDSPGSQRSWGPSPSSSTSLRASVGTAPRPRWPTRCPSWRKERRETRASLVCQAWTTVPGASQNGRDPEPRRPGETTVRESPAVLGAPAYLGLRDCQAREEKRVHRA